MFWGDGKNFALKNLKIFLSKLVPVQGFKGKCSFSSYYLFSFFEKKLGILGILEN